MEGGRPWTGSWQVNQATDSEDGRRGGAVGQEPGMGQKKPQPAGNRLLSTETRQQAPKTRDGHAVHDDSIIKRTNHQNACQPGEPPGSWR